MTSSMVPGRRRLPDGPVTEAQQGLCPILVLSLPESPRRALIVERLGRLGLPFEFVDGVRITHRDQLPEEFDARVALRRFGRRVTLSEVGSTAAHRRALERIVDSGWSMAIVIEDDAAFSEAFGTVARNTIERMRQGDVALLCHWSVVRPSRFQRIEVGPGFDLCYVHRRSPVGGVGYVVTREAARALRERKDQVSSTPDDWEHAGTSVVLRAVLPPVVLHADEFGSEIGSERSEIAYAPPRWSTRVSYKMRQVLQRTGRAGRLCSDASLLAANAMRYRRLREHPR